MNENAWFVTGTDTEIGKTHAACQLLARARALGRCAAGVKAVAAGTDAKGINEDVAALAAMSTVALPREVMNPYCFAAPLSPHLAAAAEGTIIELPRIAAAVATAKRSVQWLLVEGAGGFLAPLTESQTMADLAFALDLPVIVVVGMRLGCLNHAFLTAEAIRRRGLRFAGWVANHIDPAMACPDGNLRTLQRGLGAPCLGVIPYGAARDEVGWVRWPDELAG